MYQNEFDDGTIKNVRKLIFDEISETLTHEISIIEVLKLSVLDIMLRHSGSTDSEHIHSRP